MNTTRLKHLRSLLIRDANMTNHDKYLSTLHKLRQRYYDNGRLVLSVGGVYAKYMHYENLAAVKYLGCSLRKDT